MSDDVWTDSAACKGMTALMFDDDRIDEAMAVCAVCPVRGPCLDRAIARREAFGVWGGEKFYGSKASKLERAREREAS